MKIFVNDKEKEISAGLSLSLFLEQADIPASKTVVTLNGNTLQIDEFAVTELKEGDSLELFSFVGGG